MIGLNTSKFLMHLTKIMFYNTLFFKLTNKIILKCKKNNKIKTLFFFL